MGQEGPGRRQSSALAPHSPSRDLPCRGSRHQSFDLRGGKASCLSNPWLAKAPPTCSSPATERASVDRTLRMPIRSDSLVPAAAFPVRSSVPAQPFESAPAPAADLQLCSRSREGFLARLSPRPCRRRTRPVRHHRESRSAPWRTWKRRRLSSRWASPSWQGGRRRPDQCTGLHSSQRRRRRRLPLRQTVLIRDRYQPSTTQVDR